MDTSNIEQRLKDSCPQLRGETSHLLAEMYAAGELYGTECESPVTLKPSTRISIAQGRELHRLIRDSGARKSIEIGFAYGFSTVWILDALPEGDGDHTAVDPFEKSLWHGVGLRQVGRLPFSIESFRWIEDWSIHVLSQEIKRGIKYDFVFIDGNHRFDDVLVDFYLSDQILKVGGLLVLDDMWMPSIRSVASFVETNRSYQLLRQPVKNMAVFRKNSDDARDWSHFERFSVSRGRIAGSLRNFVVRVAHRTGTYDVLRNLQDSLVFRRP